jgi:hypothetical protein
MSVAMAAFTIGQSGIDALFFDRVGAQVLPVMYLLQGGATFVAMLALTGTLGRLAPRPVLLSLSSHRARDLPATWIIQRRPFAPRARCG